MEYECHFTFKTVVRTHGSDAEGALENVSSMFTDNVLESLSLQMGTGVDYIEEMTRVQEVHNGWFELTLLWSGCYYSESENRIEAAKMSKELLNHQLSAFYQSLERMSDKNRLFQFLDLKEEKMTDVLESGVIL